MRELESRLRDLLSNDRVTPPSMKWKVVDRSDYFKVYQESIENHAKFWAKESVRLQWVKAWRSVYEGTPPRVYWFTHGRLNAYFNVIGKHANNTSTWNKPALIWEGEEGVAKIISYRELDELVNRIASSLKVLGVRPGDWILIYAPPLIESIATMLAAVKIGAPFEPVFTGFGFFELAKRILNRRPVAVFTSDGFYRRGKEINTLSIMRRALEHINYRTNVIVYERLGPAPLRDGELAFSDFIKTSYERADDFIADSNHPLFGLHSGYIEDHKPITHPTAGFLVQVFSTSNWIGIRPRDTYFCTVWPGWITGVSYVVFGPLMIGSTVVIYDGGPDYPSLDRWWGIIEDYAVTVFLTTSGALRVLSRAGNDHVLSKNIDTLRVVLVTAEPLETSTWWWTYRVVGTGKTPLITSIPEKLTGRIPVVNLYIQSEIGSFVTGNLVNYVFAPIAPGSAGLPIPGFHVEVVDEEGGTINNGFGELALMKPWPSTPLEFPIDFEVKWSKGCYRTGDFAYRSVDGYIYPLGRLDGVLKVSGYRLSPGSIADAVKRALGIEASVVKCYDDIRFEGIVILYSESLDPNSIRNAVRDYVGAIADPVAVIKVPKEELKDPRATGAIFIDDCRKFSTS